MVQPMVTVGLHYDVLPGRNAEFEERFGQVLAALADWPGHAGSRLFRDVWDKNSYLVYSEWSDREAFQKFVQSDVFAATAAWGHTVLAGRPRHRVYTEAADH